MSYEGCELETRVLELTSMNGGATTHSIACNVFGVNSVSSIPERS